MMTLEMIMSTELITISPEDSLETARTLMHDNQIHHLPVLDDAGKLVGLVTLTNVLAATDSILRQEDNKIDSQQVAIRDIMVQELATVEQNASLRQAALFLEKHRIGCLPVLNGEELIGIVTDNDFVGVAINLLEQIEESEPYEDDDYD